jgi:hypothetical protein
LLPHCVVSQERENPHWQRSYLNAGSILCAFSLLILCGFVLLISSNAFQEQFEYLDELEVEKARKLELEKTNDSNEKLIPDAQKCPTEVNAQETTETTITGRCG